MVPGAAFEEKAEGNAELKALTAQNMFARSPGPSSWPPFVRKAGLVLLLACSMSVNGLLMKERRRECQCDAG